MVAIVSGNGLGLLNSSLGLLGAGGAGGNAGLGRSGEGVYLNAATGNLILQRQDDLLVGPGQDINLVRTYNSQGLFNDDNRDNWRLGVHERIGNLVGTIGAAGSSIRRTGADGVELTYGYDATLGRYVNKDGAGSFDYLDYNSAAATWSWQDGNTRVVEKYDWIGGAGKLLSVSELGSATGITYSYTGNNLTMITGEDGEKVTFDYSGNNLTAIHTIDANNVVTTRVRYTYDTSSRLSSVVVDLTPGDNSVADGKTYVTTYTYDGASTRVASITQTDGSRVDFIYKTQSDASVRVAQITQSLAGSTRVTNIAYDLAARSTSVTDPLGNVTVYSYDAQGRLLNLQGPAVGDSLTNPGVSYSYDADGNVASQTDARGLVTTYQYDASGNLTLQRDAAGNTVTRTYGSANELLTETSYLVPDPDGAGSGVPGAPLTTRYVYDSLARLRFVVSAEGRVSEYRYGAGSSRLVGASVTYAGTAYTTATGSSTPAQLYDALAAWAAGATVDKTRSTLTSVVRDSRGQVSSSTVYAKVDASGAGVADGSESTTRYIYDQAGQLLQTIAPKGVATTTVADDFVTNYTYDGLGRLLSATDALKYATLYQYDDAGNTTRTTSANGLVTTSAYNRAGELVTLTQSSGATALGATSYQYDADGRLRMTQDPLGLRHFYFYDPAGRKVAELDANGSLTEYRYNQDNQLVQTVAHATAVTAAALASLVDASGNVTAVALATIVPAASALDLAGWNFYDNAGRLVKTRDGLGYVTEFKYDGAGRRVSQLRYANAATGTVTLATLASDAAATPALNSAADRVTRNFYDNDGLLLGTLDGAGYLTENEYDSAGRLVHTLAYATLTSATYFASGTLAQLRPLANANDIHNWTWYDGQGRAVAQVDGEGYLTETAYDANGNVTQQKRYANKALLAPTALTAATTLASLRPAATNTDQMVSWMYTDLNQVKSQTDAQGTITQYLYNSMGQLTRTDKAAGSADLRTAQVRYDLQGRVIAELSGEGTAALNALVAPNTTLIDGVWAQYGTSYRYDAGGRRISSTDANGYVTRFYYDADGNLKYTVNAMGEVRQSSYNALNQLAQSTAYAKRVDATTLAALQGGDAATVDAAIAALANIALDSTAGYSYDARGLLVAQTEGQEKLHMLTLNAFGETTAQVDRIGAGATVRTEYGYDKRGLLGRTTEDATGLARVTSQVKDAFGRTTQTIYANGSTAGASYDRLGRAVQVYNPLHAAHSHTYDAFGRILTDRDSNGKVTTYAYDTAARSMTITTPEGVSTTTTSDRYGDTVQVKDGNGYTTTYVYDRDGNLRSSTNDKLGAVESRAYDHADRLIESTDANGVKTAYGYDAANRVWTRTVDPSGLKLVTTYGYDAKGQTVSVTDPNGALTQTAYDNLGRVKSVTVDPAGLALQTQYTYDALDEVLTVTEGAGSATARVTQYTFDKLGRRTQQVLDPAGLKLTTTYTYDSNDNVVSRTDAAGTAQAATTRYTYDAADRLVYTIDALGGVKLNSYSSEGLLLQSTAYANALTTANLAAITVGSLAASTTIAGLVVADAARDRVTRHAYDNDGRERFTIDALGAVTERQYDKAGNLSKLVQYANALGGTLAAGALPLVLTAASGTAGYVVSSGADRVSTYVYDAANRLTSQTRGVGSAAATTESWAYDQAGNTLSHTDGRLNTTWFAYDAANRQVRQVDAAGYLTTRSYYPDGTLASVTRFKNAVGMPAATDALWASHAPAAVPNTDPVQGDQLTSYTYDKAYRVATAKDAGGNITRYAYDALGNTTDTTLADGTDAAVTTHRTFDLAGRIATETRAFGTSVASTTGYAYDALGNSTDTTSAYGTAAAVTTHRTYDLVGRITTETRAFSTAVASTTRYAYDVLDNQTDIFVADGTAVAQHTVQTFDLDGRKTGVIAADGGTTSTSYNAFGDIVKVTDALRNVGYFYTDALGRVTMQVDPTGAVTETRYDAAGNVVATIHYANRVQGALSETVRPQVLSAAGSGVYVVSNAALDQQQTALVDALGRTTEIRTWYGAGANDFYTEAYSYDGAGNVLTAKARNGAVTTYRYDMLNRKIVEVLPVTSKNPAGTPVGVENHYAYDAFGNLTDKLEAYGLTEQRETKYQFDALNRQILELRQPINTLDPATRVDKLVPPVKIQLFDQRGNVIEEIDLLGGRTLHYYDQADREVGRVDPTGAYTVYQYDAADNKVSQTSYANVVAVVGGGAIANSTAPVVLAAGTTAPASGSYVMAQDPSNRVDRTTRFAYDGVGRLVATYVDQVNVASYNLTAATGQNPVELQTKTLSTLNQYDAQGNMVKSTDARGAVTRRYYNSAGQLVGQLDALGYLTVWQRDAFGNVSRETQYANAVANKASVSDYTTLADLTAAGNLVGSASDRITDYTYDRLNRLLTQARLAVSYGTVDALGKLTEATASAVTSYQYDGLSHIVRQTDAAGAVTDTDYDGLGRKTEERRPGYVDYLGKAVRPTTDYEYDGLNSLTRQIERGTDNSTENDDRITQYFYSTGGYLIAQTDPAQARLEYRTDVAGNIVRKTLVGLKDASGAAITSVTDYWYDALGHEIKHTDQATGAKQETRYNAFGEISGKRTNGSGTVWAETTEYDNAGRAWRTNAGDGIVKVYLYDENGNATLKIDNAVVDLRAVTFDATIRLNTSNQTASVYDARNQLVDTVQPPMSGQYNIISIHQNLTEQQGTNYTGALQNLGAPTDPLAGGNNAVSGIAKGTVDVTAPVGQPYSMSSVYSKYRLTAIKDYVAWSYTAYHDLTLTMPPSLYGTGKLTIHVQIPGSGSLRGVDETFTVDYATTIVLPRLSETATGREDYPRLNEVSRQLTYTISQTPVGGSPVQLVNYTGSINAGKTPPLTVPNSGTAKMGGYTLLFSNQNPTANSLILMTRPVSGGGWTATPVSLIASGQFQLDWSSWPRDSYVYKYLVLDANNNVLNSESGSVLMSDSPWRSEQTALPMGGYGLAGSPGSAFMDSSGGINFTEQGAAATSLMVRVRLKDSNSVWTEIGPLGAATVGRQINGWFVFNPAGLSGNYEYIIEARDQNNNLVNTPSAATGFFTVGSADIPAMSFYKGLPTTLTFNGLPSTAHDIKLTYTIPGSTVSKTVPIGIKDGKFTWDSSTEFLSYTQTKDYAFSYVAYDANAVLVSAGHGVMTLGAVLKVTSVNDSTPTMMSFAVPSGSAAATATQAALTYNVAGSAVRTTVNVPITWSNDTPPKGVFSRDVSDLIAPGTGGLIEYSYTLLTGGSQTLKTLLAPDGKPMTVSGTLAVGSAAGAPLLTWTATPVPIVALVHHTQVMNAFGEVVRETDNNQYITDLTYNTLGQLVLKQEHETDVTLANGFVTRQRPTTTYIYDLAGHLVGVRDANGNLNTQALVNGAELVTTQFNADGGSKKNGYDVFGDLRYTIDEVQRRTDYSYDRDGRLTRIDRPVEADQVTRAYDSYVYDAAGNRISHSTTPGGGVVYTDKTYYDSLGRVIKTVTPLGRQTSYGYVWDSAIMGITGGATGGWRKTTTDAMGRTIVDDTDLFNHTTRHTDLGGHVFVYTFNSSGWLTSQTSANSGQNISYDYYANGYVKDIIDHTTNMVTSYAYDAAGNRIYEANINATDSLENSVITYDSMNRVIGIKDPRAEIRYEYDAMGNRRRVWSYYHDGVNGSAQVQDYWYAYDSMNRFTVTMGQLSSANNTRASSAGDTSVFVTTGALATDGVQVMYNLAGERIETITARDAHREDYTYGSEGYLQDTYVNMSSTTAKGTLGARRTNDLLGRTVKYEEFLPEGGSKLTRSDVFDADNRLLSEAGTTAAVGTTPATASNSIYYYYSGRSSDGSDNAATVAQNGVGELARVDMTQGSVTTKTSTFYDYWDQGKQRDVTVQGGDPRLGASNLQWKEGVSSYSYDANGHLVGAVNAGSDGVKGNANDINYKYVSNAQGMVLLRQRSQAGVQTGVHTYMYLNGATVGDVGDDGDQHKDYAQTLTQAPTDNSGLYKNWTPIASADFDQNYQPINAEYPAAVSSNYVVNTGDTLYSIAAAAWGDATLWYLIADANGLIATSDLKAGQTLRIPNKVANQHNTSATMRPYDAGKRIGDTSPTLPDAPQPPAPPAPKHGGCGVLGTIIVIIVAVVVTYITAGIASEALGAAAGTVTAGGAAVGAAVGSVASQLVGMGIGVQSKFNWGAVATAAVGGAATVGLSNFAQGAFGASGNTALAVNAAARNIVTQGAGMLLGQQKSFSWGSVAASAIAAPLMKTVQDSVFGTAAKGGLLDGYGTWASDNPFGANLAQNGVSSLVAAATRMAVVGGKLQWEAVAADAIGGALGQTYGANNAAPTYGATFGEDRAAREAMNPLLGGGNVGGAGDSYSSPNQQGEQLSPSDIAAKVDQVMRESGGKDYMLASVEGGSAAHGASQVDEAGGKPGQPYPTSGTTIFEGNAVPYNARFESENNYWSLETADDRRMLIEERTWGPSGEFVSDSADDSGRIAFKQGLDINFKAGTSKVFREYSDIWSGDASLQNKLYKTFDLASYSPPEGMTFGNVAPVGPNPAAVAFESMLANPFAGMLGGYMAKNGNSADAISHATTAMSAAGGVLTALSGFGAQRTLAPQVVGDPTAEILNESAQVGKYAIRDDIFYRPASEVNSTFPEGWSPPYKPGTRVTEFTSTVDDTYVRVHGETNMARSWMMKPEAIDGLSAAEIQSKYALPDLPTYMSEVLVPTGTRIRTGIVNPVFGGIGNATQYELLQRLPPSAFSKTVRIEK